jgi:hypothetical protein
MSHFPVGITGAIVSKWLGTRYGWLFLRKHLREFDTISDRPAKRNKGEL